MKKSDIPKIQFDKEKFKAIREEAGLNQSELSRQSNVTQRWISNVESGGIAEPTVTRLARCLLTMGKKNIECVMRVG